MDCSGAAREQAVTLRYFDAAPDLRGFVSAFYLFDANAPVIRDVLRAEIAQIRFVLRGGGDYLLAGERRDRAPPVTLVGPTMAAVGLELAGPLTVFGVGIRPAGWAALVRDDASLFADRLEDATTIFGDLLCDALDALRAAPTADTMVSIGNAVIRALIADAPERPMRFTRLMEQWLTSNASPGIDALVAQAGMSARQIERLSKRIYGAPPKLLARKYRVLRVASLIGQRDMPWAEAAGETFYDQSHFIREFKQFIGVTPQRFQRDPPTLTRLTMATVGRTHAPMLVEPG